MTTDPTAWHLAEFNVARQRVPWGHPDLAEFAAMLEPVNQLADQAPGFIWRYTTDAAADATAARPYGDLVIINFSVWESPEALWEFTYRSPHLDAMRRRREWFDRLGDHHLVLWWVEEGKLPTLEEALARLALLRRRGPSPEAFTFRERFDPPRPNDPSRPGNPGAANHGDANPERAAEASPAGR